MPGDGIQIFSFVRILINLKHCFVSLKLFLLFYFNFYVLETPHLLLFINEFTRLWKHADDLKGNIEGPSITFLFNYYYFCDKWEYINITVTYAFIDWFCCLSF